MFTKQCCASIRRRDVIGFVRGVIIPGAIWMRPQSHDIESELQSLPSSKTALLGLPLLNADWPAEQAEKSAQGLTDRPADQTKPTPTSMIPTYVSGA
jgi:hypothetical protein